MTTADIKAITPRHCWDDANDMPFRWEMPDSHRDFAIEVDEDGDVAFTCGTTWTVRHVEGITADEARWMRDIWPAVVLAIDTYVGVQA
jgi:hypothetical protein